MSKKKVGILVAVLVLLMVGIVWAFRRDRQLQKVRDMIANNAPREEIWREVRKLPEEQRWQLGGERMQQQMRKQVDGYFALPPEKRTAYLDERIREEQKFFADMQKQWQERAKQRAQNGQQGKNPPGPGGPPGAGPGNGGRGPGGGNRNATTRSERANRRLDNTSPAQRAQWMAYRDAMNKRRQQLGLPVGPGGGGRGPRGH
ncbi:MAG: hypothetical protein ABFC96_04835 [Thermoguttaceae bacterium]